MPVARHITTVGGITPPGRDRTVGASKPDDTALIQYTSGSTGTPKGVVLLHANLLANIRAIGDGLAVQPDDVCVSWLPLYHDMGLIGAWLTPLYFGVPVAIMSHSRFWLAPRAGCGPSTRIEARSPLLQTLPSTSRRARSPTMRYKVWTSGVGGSR